MSVMRSLIVFAAFCWSAVAAPVPKDINRRDAFAGTWKLTKNVIDGRTFNDSENDVFWTIDEKHELRLKIAAKKEATPPVVKPLPIGWVVTTAAAAPTNLEFDTTRNEIDYKRGEMTRMGRFELRGDMLTIVLGLPGSGRPGTMRDIEDTLSWTLERASK